MEGFSLICLIPPFLKIKLFIFSSSFGKHGEQPEYSFFTAACTKPPFLHSFLGYVIPVLWIFFPIDHSF